VNVFDVFLTPGRRTALALAGSTACGIALVALGASPAAAAPATGQILASGSSTAVEGSYIVVLKDEQTVDQARTKALTARYGGTVNRVFGHAVHGYTAKLSAKQAARLAADPAVAAVEQDQQVSLESTQTSPTWGLDRIDQTRLPLDSSYTYGPSSGVNVYVIDTGVRISHSDFGGRAKYGYDAVDGDTIASDGNGHGTFVSGVIAGSTYGVAKNANIVAVRVLDNAGSGTTAGVIAGIDWVTANAVAPAVANLSLGGGASTTLDAAVRRSIAAGITYSIAAGNDGVSASTTSPARVTEAITVGATSSTDARASWSNYGSVLDLFAPGVSITSDWRTSDSATYTGSGTSFAAPHVAGAAALYLHSHPTATPAAVSTALVNAATSGVVTSPGTGSPNKLLYTGSLS
jgi:subtilisin family serine protease